MPLHIIACVKRTPASTSVAVDPQTGAIETDGLAFGLNPLDEYAVEEALRLKEKISGSTVLALSLGPPAAEETLRSVLALGADAGILLSDPKFEGSDSYATAYLLSLAVRKLHQQRPVNLVLCGKQTNDGESGHVGPHLAAWLGWPGVSMVRKILEISDAYVLLERWMEDGIDTLKLKLPAVLSTTKEINEPRLPSLKGKMAAKKAEIPCWGAQDLKVDAAIVGTQGSPTAVIKTAPTPPRPSGTLIPGGTAQEKAANLVQKLREAKLI